MWLVLNSSSCSDYFDNFPIILPQIENILIFMPQCSEHVDVDGTTRHLVSQDPLMRNTQVILSSNEGELSSSQLGLA